MLCSCVIVALDTFGAPVETDVPAKVSSSAIFALVIETAPDVMTEAVRSCSCVSVSDAMDGGPAAILLQVSPCS